MSNAGKIVQSIGPVVDADLSQARKLPEIYHHLEVYYDING